jgi:hypothetical protein
MRNRFFDVLAVALTAFAADSCSSPAALPGQAPDCNGAPNDAGVVADGASLEAGKANCVVVVGVAGEPSGASSGTGTSSGGAGSGGVASSGVASSGAGSGGVASGGVASSGAGSSGGPGVGIGIGSSSGASPGTSPVGGSSGSI